MSFWFVCGVGVGLVDGFGGVIVGGGVCVGRGGGGGVWEGGRGVLAMNFLHWLEKFKFLFWLRLES